MEAHTILNQILFYKKNWILTLKKKFPLSILKNQIQSSERNFYKAISKNQTVFILEYKRASPSKGIICTNLDPIKTAHIYQKYASIISVVTDEKYFHGNFDILFQISNAVTQPILCKDFFISKWQIYFARFHQADGILLMLSVINDETYKTLSHTAHTLNMGILTEVSNKNELQRAISLNAKVIGINNRNLHNLSIDLNRTIKLSTNIPNSVITISESGITNYCDIRKLRRYVNGFLIGSTLMSHSQNQLKIAIHKLILGENKICGITRPEDAYIANKLGATYIGLIFVKNSPRFLHIDTAKHIKSNIKESLNYIGVFCNEEINYIIEIVKTLHLHAVQLHGTENQEYIHTLRTKLPTTCKIWKSINMSQKPPSYSFYDLKYIDRYLLDNGKGSGKPFNWTYIKNIKLNKTILAGGLTINNCAEAAKLGCLGLDFNSGVEDCPGIKNHQKLIKIFQILRTY